MTDNDGKAVSMKKDNLGTTKTMVPPPPPLRKRRLPPEHSKTVVRVPECTTRQELETIKLTAQSGAQHGMSCWHDLTATEDMGLWFFCVPGLSFLYFVKLCAHYLSWTPTMISSSWTAPNADENAEKKRLVEENQGLALLDSPEVRYLPLLTPHKDGPEPKPKRQKLDKPALVPEDQFLSQHPGLSSIRVFVPKRGVVEITVQSLSEHVASLKEKIAEGIRIPATKHKLWGKAGDLEDNKTLAHYNVGAGEILILFWCL